MGKLSGQEGAGHRRRAGHRAGDSAGLRRARAPTSAIARPAPRGGAAHGGRDRGSGRARPCAALPTSATRRRSRRRSPRSTAALGDDRHPGQQRRHRHDSRVADMPTEMWDDMMRVNLRSVFLCTRAVLPAMRRKKWGRIINISSQLAHKGAADMAHYCAAKAGVIGFTRSLAYEVARDGVTVNCDLSRPDRHAAVPQHPGGLAQARSWPSCRSAAPAVSTRSRRRRCCWPPTRAPIFIGASIN